MPVTLVMLEAIRDYYYVTGKMIGMKPAGGISTAKSALHYLVMVKETLGTDWLTNEWFRFGASSLANDVLLQLMKQKTGNYQSMDYFSTGVLSEKSFHASVDYQFSTNSTYRRGVSALSHPITKTYYYVVNNQLWVMQASSPDNIDCRSTLSKLPSSFPQVAMLAPNTSAINRAIISFLSSCLVIDNILKTESREKRSNSLQRA